MNAPEIARPAHVAAEEWRLREELATCYHLFDHLGWTEMIFNHISLRVPGAEPRYLMNPYGLNYHEVTPANLVKVDLEGRLVEPSPYPGNPAGFAIHGAIHAARPDAHCVIHTHTTAGMAVAGKRDGLRHDDFYGALLYGRVAYHDFEGITVRADEGPRLKASLGDKDCLILRNHGLLVVGRDVPSAFLRYWQLQRACEIQVAVASMQGADNMLDDAVRAQAARDAGAFDPSGALPRAFFDAAVRKMRASSGAT
jgi:ribulose-5-phosphate 4-epimerase/fuculose-1-phosphate aldolase